MSINSDWDSKSAGKAKISNLYDTLFVDEEILRFEISVEHPSLMAIEDSLEKLQIKELSIKMDIKSKE